MSEPSQNLRTKEALRQEYLELTRKQTSSKGWTEKDRKKLLELKVHLGIDQPKLTQKQKEALHRQGSADTSLIAGEKPQPSLTEKERKLIVKTNIDSLLSS